MRKTVRSEALLSLSFFKVKERRMIASLYTLWDSDLVPVLYCNGQPSVEKHAHPPRVVYCTIYSTLTRFTKFRVSKLHITSTPDAANALHQHILPREAIPSQNHVTNKAVAYLSFGQLAYLHSAPLPYMYLGPLKFVRRYYQTPMGISRLIFPEKFV